MGRRFTVVIENESDLAICFGKHVKQYRVDFEFLKIEGFQKRGNQLYYNEELFHGFDDDDVILMRFDNFTYHAPLYREIAILGSNALQMSNRLAWLEFPDSSDKYYQYHRFVEYGVVCQPTYLVEQLKQMDMPVPMIAKRRLGSRGRGSLIVNHKNCDEFIRKTNADNYILQPLQDVVRDVRVLVINSKIIGAVTRRVVRYADGHIGVRVISGVELSTIEKKLVYSAVSALDLDFSGVDILTNKEGDVWVCEANLSPQFSGFERVTQVDVVREIVDRYLSE